MKFDFGKYLPMLNMWQMFATYKGLIDDEYHTFFFPNFLDEKYQVALQVDKDKKLKFITHGKSGLKIDVEIPFDESKKTFFINSQKP